MTENFNWRDQVADVEATIFQKVEAKVKAASTAAFLVGAGTQALGLYVFHGAVPDWATATVGSLVTGLLTFAGGWLAKHTPRTK